MAVAFGLVFLVGSVIWALSIHYVVVHGSCVVTGPGQALARSCGRKSPTRARITIIGVGVLGCATTLGWARRNRVRPFRPPA